MYIVHDLGDLSPVGLTKIFLQELGSVQEQLKEMKLTMAQLVKVANEVKEAVNARIDREIAKQQELVAAKQAELDALIAAEDAEDVEQNAEIARLTAEVSGQNEAIGILESIKSGVNSDLNGDGGMVVPDPVEEEPVVEQPVEGEPVEGEPVVEQPVEPVEGEEPAVPDAGDVVAEAPQTQTAEGEVVGDGTAVQQ